MTTDGREGAQPRPQQTPTSSGQSRPSSTSSATRTSEGAESGWRRRCAPHASRKRRCTFSAPSSLCDWLEVLNLHVGVKLGRLFHRRNDEEQQRPSTRCCPRSSVLRGRWDRSTRSGCSSLSLSMGVFPNCYFFTANVGLLLLLSPRPVVVGCMTSKKDFLISSDSLTFGFINVDGVRMRWAYVAHIVVALTLFLPSPSLQNK